MLTLHACHMGRSRVVGATVEYRTDTGAAYDGRLRALLRSPKNARSVDLADGPLAACAAGR